MKAAACFDMSISIPDVFWQEKAKVLKNAKYKNLDFLWNWNIPISDYSAERAELLHQVPFPTTIFDFFRVEILDIIEGAFKQAT